MKVHEQYQDVLQNIEFVIVDLYRTGAEMSDHNAIHALEATIDFCAAEKIGRKPRDFALSPIEEALFDQLKDVCLWRLGRKPSDERESDTHFKSITLDEMLLCLKTVLKSARHWNEECGRKGYLDYVSQFIL